jgi:hypothetical protein
MPETASLGLPLLVAEQAQKHVTHNEALTALDAVVQLSVKDRDLTTPPGAPAHGDRYVVAAAGTDAWAGHDDEIAAWQDGAWIFHPPSEGWRCWVDDEDALLVFDGADWVDAASSISVLQNLARLGIGTTADATNPFAAKLNKALWTALTAGEGGDGDLRFTLNKETAADVLSLLMQSGFSGRAEMGLIGDDDLAVKVSPNGSSWAEAIRINKTTGSVDFPSGSTALPKAGGTMTGALTINAADAIGCKIARLDDGTLGGCQTLYHNSASPATNDNIGIWQAQGNDSGGAAQIYGNFALRALAVAAGGHGGKWEWSARTAGSNTLLMQLDGSNGMSVGGNIAPMTDDLRDLGSASFRWDDVYATNGTIQTSDAGEKDIRGGLTTAELRAGARMSAVMFRWLGSIADKGQSAREHAGFVAQEVREALAAEGLDPEGYAFFIEAPIVVPETRTLTKEVRRPKMRQVERETSRVEIREGVPVRIVETVTEAEPVGEWKAVVNEDGTPATNGARDREGGSLEGDERGAVEPLLAFVPEMETVVETSEHVGMAPALDETGAQKMRLGLRMTELLAFLDACRRAEVAALAARVALLEEAAA